MFDYSKLSKVTMGERFSNISLTCSLASYDGRPVHGKCKTEEREGEFWFQNFFEHWVKLPSSDEEDPSFVVVEVFHLIELTPEQKSYAEYWNEEFKKYVGEHLEYVNGSRDHDKVKPESTWNVYYEKRKKLREEDIPKLLDTQVIGWFELRDFLYT